MSVPSMNMTVSDNTFVPAPEGMHRAVCVDLVDLGTQQTSFGPKDKVRFVFELDPESAGLHPDFGSRFCLFVTCNKSLHPESTMGKMLRRWRGKDFTIEEQESFDVEKIVGAPCVINVVHNVGGDGKTYANADPVMKVPKGQEPLEPSGEFEREFHRENSRDVRSPNYVGDGGPAGQKAAPSGDGGASKAPSYGDNFGAENDDLPF